MPFDKKMHKYFGEIVRNVDAARIVCEDHNSSDHGLCAERNCSFAPKRDDPENKQECKLNKLLELMGENDPLPPL